MKFKLLTFTLVAGMLTTNVGALEASAAFEEAFAQAQMTTMEETVSVETNNLEVENELESEDIETSQELNGDPDENMNENQEYLETETAEVPVLMADSEVTVGDYTYGISNGTMYLKSYNGTDSVITVPDSVVYDGRTYYITTIGNNCFAGNNSIQEVTLPARITAIGKCAFKNCTYLSKLTILGDIADCSAYSNKIDSNAS